MIWVRGVGAYVIKRIERAVEANVASLIGVDIEPNGNGAYCRYHCGQSLYALLEIVHGLFLFLKRKAILEPENNDVFDHIRRLL